MIISNSDKIILAFITAFGFLTYLIGAFGKFDGTYAVILVLFAFSFLWLRHEVRIRRVNINEQTMLEQLALQQKLTSEQQQKEVSQGETYKLAYGVEFKNPWGGVNYKTYAGRANMPDGRTSSLMLQAKYRDTEYSEAFNAEAPPEAAGAANDNLVFELALISENIRQARASLAPDMAVLWIVGDETGKAGEPFLSYVKSFVEKAIRDGSHSTISGVTNPRWFSEFFYFGKCRGYQPGTTMELPDKVWRYSYHICCFDEVSVGSILRPEKVVS